jgi:hypothetical protein
MPELFSRAGFEIANSTPACYNASNQRFRSNNYLQFGECHGQGEQQPEERQKVKKAKAGQEKTRQGRQAVTFGPAAPNSAGQPLWCGSCIV